MSEATPPPFPGETTPVRTGFQFSTATLLGLTTLVAVGCALAVTFPALLGLLLALLANLITIAFAAFLIAGGWFSTGDRRLFCIASFSCMVLTGMTNLIPKIAYQLYSNTIMWGDAMHMLSILLSPAEVAALSLFGGWIAVRTKRFWASKEVSLSTQVPPPASGNNVS